MVHNVGGQVKLEPGDLERYIRTESSRKGMSREPIPILAMWLRNQGGKAQVLVETEGKRGRKWFLVMEESLQGPFSHIAEVAGILDSPADPLTSKP